MSRVPGLTVDSAPAASRPLLQKIVESSPGGRLFNLHAQMANSPAVLAAYVALRAALAEQSSFDPKTGAALTLATAAAVGNHYMIAITSRLAQMSGWAQDQVAALRAGTATGDTRIDVLATLVREAATHSGGVNDATWKAAQQAGWSDAQLTDAFAHVGATVFTAYFLNFAQTDPDV